MSGRKTITVDTADYNRLRQQAARATTLTEANNALNRINQALTNSVNQANNRINTLTNNINSLNNQISSVRANASKEVNALRTQLQNTVRESNRQLTQMAEANRREMERLQGNFQSALEQTRRETASSIAENNRRIEATIADNNRRIEATIAENNRQTNRRIDAVAAQTAAIGDIVNSAQHDLGLLRDMAVEFTNTARMLLDDARKYRCELLLPGELARVQQQLNAALEQQKLPEVNAPVAQLTSRQAYESALEFHERIIQAEQAWILRHRAAKESIAQAQGRIEASRTVTHEDTKLPVDVNHWSEGDLDELSADANELMGMLDEETDRLTLRDLDQIRVTGQWLEHETVETTAFALGAIEASQDRVCAAQDIADMLSDSNSMIVVDHGYQGDDMRGAHRIHLRNNVTGLSLVITQSRSQGANGKPGECFEVDVADPGSGTINDVHQITGEILSGLRDAGYPVQSIQEVPGCSDINSGRKETANLTQWRTETATRVKPRHTTRPAKRVQTN